MSAVLEMLETAKKQSPVHAVDPRAKSLWLFFLIIVPIVTTNQWILGTITLFILLLAPVAGIGRKLYRLLLTTYPVLVGFIMLTWPFFYKGGTRVLLDWAFIHVTVEGVIYAFAMGLRIVMAVTACTFFVMTTDIMELASAVGESCQNRFGWSFTWPLMIISSFKFLPELMGDFITIEQSFLSRGAVIRGHGVVHWLKSVVPLFIPLIDSTLRRAQNIATALQLKAFGANKKRTFFVERHMGARDYLFILSGAAALAFAIYARIAGFGHAIL
ncbi:MAG: energy-coupling factor transporter transmembrane component T [Bacillota bacterium]